MVLHGIYENGKIKIKEKKLPKIRAEVEIKILEHYNKNQSFNKNNGKYDFKGMFDELNIRELAHEQ